MGELTNDMLEVHKTKDKMYSEHTELMGRREIWDWNDHVTLLDENLKSGHTYLEDEERFLGLLAVEEVRFFSLVACCTKCLH